MLYKMGEIHCKNSEYHYVREGNKNVEKELVTLIDIEGYNSYFRGYFALVLT